MSPSGSGTAQFRGGPDAGTAGREDLTSTDHDPPGLPRNPARVERATREEAIDARHRRAKLVGCRISLARRANGLSRAQLAELLDDTSVHISGWELGRHEPSAVNLLRLSEVLEVPMWFFFGGPPAGD